MSSVRVRFAPSPTGFMHVGNVRAALINYLFARRHEGTFVLRIEDTDAERNFDPGAQRLLHDLAWLGLTYDEGPLIGGPHVPYYQSERAHLYRDYLDKLQHLRLVYPCFCTLADLERQRERQVAQKKPPRYERTCLALTEQERADRMAQQIPFVWRIQLPARTIQVKDLAHGTMDYDLTHFSDCTLTRPDGSFTFLFANFVDDVTMGITHVIRGEDHLTNTGNQAALYTVLGIPVPTFWHLPIMRNHEGKKLSKRDFGFSLKDLQESGYLPEAILNYLAIIGGSYDTQCLPIYDLVPRVDQLNTTSPITYDEQQLSALNHAWIQRIDLADLTERLETWCTQIPGYSSLPIARRQELVDFIRPELHTLAQAPTLISSLVTAPQVSSDLASDSRMAEVIAQFLADRTDITAQDLPILYSLCTQAGIEKKSMFPVLRTLLLGTPQGAHLGDIVRILGPAETRKRLAAIAK